MTHFHYVSWPDFGVPESPDPIIRLVEDVKKQVKSNKRADVRILVHCSAGVGRTGTFIGLYQSMDILDTFFGKCTSVEEFRTCATEHKIDLFNIVFSLRRKRMQMVSSKMLRPIQFVIWFDIWHWFDNNILCCK